eukprot:762946-Hanusia_phi.AAC.2
MKRTRTTSQSATKAHVSVSQHSAVCEAYVLTGKQKSVRHGSAREGSTDEPPNPSKPKEIVSTWNGTKSLSLTRTD